MQSWLSAMRLKAVSLVGPLRTIGWAYLGTAAALILFLSIPAFLTPFGYRAYIIYGGSMGHSLPGGSVGIAKRVDAEAIAVGDVVALHRSSQSLPILHRVIAIDASSGTPMLITQGDANKEPDATPVGLQGKGDKIVLAIPWIGYVANFSHGAFGRLLLFYIPLSLLVGSVLWDTWKPGVPRPYLSEEPQC